MVRVSQETMIMTTLLTPVSKKPLETSQQATDSPSDQDLALPFNELTQHLRSQAEAMLPDWFVEHTIVYHLLCMVALVTLTLSSYFILRYLVLRPIFMLFSHGERQFGHMVIKSRILGSISWLVPLILVWFLAHILPKVTPLFTGLIERIATATVVLAFAVGVTRLLSLIDLVYSSRHSSRDGDLALAGYFRVAGAVVYVVAVILIVGVLVDRSPVYFLTGLAGLTAVFTLVFKDSLLSMYANILINTNKIVCVGDWVAVPKAGANGFVTSITLNTVSIQNWDKTITTVPTYYLVQDSFTNYKGMYDSGGRRIMRSVSLDLNTIRFLDQGEVDDLVSRFSLLSDWHMKHAASPPRFPGLAEADRITNASLLRHYMTAYLRAHPDIHQDMTLLVRELQPTENGLPLELYSFTNSTDWNFFEGVQAEVIDHLVSVLPEFGLRPYQSIDDYVLGAKPASADLARPDAATEPSG